MFGSDAILASSQFAILTILRSSQYHPPISTEYPHAGTDWEDEMADELIDGTICGWPVSALVMTNPGQRGWVGLHVAAYTDEDDNSAPDCVADKIAAIPEDHPTRKQAMAALATAGFISTGAA